jgi:hypothetical protein
VHTAKPSDMFLTGSSGNINRGHGLDDDLDRKPEEEQVEPFVANVCLLQVTHQLVAGFEPAVPRYRIWCSTAELAVIDVSRHNPALEQISADLCRCAGCHRTVHNFDFT